MKLKSLKLNSIPSQRDTIHFQSQTNVNVFTNDEAEFFSRFRDLHQASLSTGPVQLSPLQINTAKPLICRGTSAPRCTKRAWLVRPWMCFCSLTLTLLKLKVNKMEVTDSWLLCHRTICTLACSLTSGSNGELRRVPQEFTHDYLFLHYWHWLTVCGGKLKTGCTGN